jgi:hypothetical protein
VARSGKDEKLVSVLQQEFLEVGVLIFVSIDNAVHFGCHCCLSASDVI